MKHLLKKKELFYFDYFFDPSIPIHISRYLFSSINLFFRMFVHYFLISLLYLLRLLLLFHRRNCQSIKELFCILNLLVDNLLFLLLFIISLSRILRFIRVSISMAFSSIILRLFNNIAPSEP